MNDPDSFTTRNIINKLSVIFQNVLKQRRKEIDTSRKIFSLCLHKKYCAKHFMKCLGLIFTVWGTNDVKRLWSNFVLP